MRHDRLVYRAILVQCQPVVDAVAKDGNLSAGLTAVQMLDSKPIFRAVRRIYMDIIPSKAEAEYRRLESIVARKKSGFGSYSPDWVAFLDFFLSGAALEKLSYQVTYTTQQRVAKYISDNIETGRGLRDLTLFIEGMAMPRAKLVARTEGTKARNAADFFAQMAAPVKCMREWSSAKDKRTRRGRRADHFHMDGMQVEQGEPFVDPVNGDRLMYAGDVSLGARAASVCNCRCRTFNVPVKDKQGEYVPKAIFVPPSSNVTTFVVGVRPTRNPNSANQQRAGMRTPQRQ